MLQIASGGLETLPANTGMESIMYEIMEKFVECFKG